MAAVESLKGKSIETVKLSYSPSYPGAISWSPDGRISVITDQCVYVLTPISSPKHAGLNLERTSIPRHKNVLLLDVGIDRKEMTDNKYSELDPKVNISLPISSGFQMVAWSPLNCDKNGRCVIATLFSDYQLFVHVSPTLGTRWKQAFDLSHELCKYLTKNSFKIDQDIMQSGVSQPNKIIDANDMSGNRKYFRFIQRTQNLAFTSLHWFSEIYHSGGDLCSAELDSLVKNNQFAILITGNQSGHVIFWKVAVPMRITNSQGVELGGFLDTQQSWPCSLSWQRLTSEQGLLAVGSTDGYVKLFSVKVLPSITGVAQYVLWGDKDDMQVQWLEWLPSTQVNHSGYQLVACKGSSVIMFSMSVKDGVLIQKPTQRIVTEVHRMPITGLACAGNGTVFTCSREGSIQMLAGEGTPTRSVDYDAKKGFLCSGIGVSANAAFITLFLSPSNYTQQSMESHQTHIVFINIACGSASIAQLLNSKHLVIENKWDVCQALQHFIHHNKNMTEEIQPKLMSPEDLETFSYPQLILRHHLLSLLVLIARNDQQDSNRSQLTEWSAQLECTVNYMYKHLATATLKSWLEGKELGSVSHSDSMSALLLCNWLVTKYGGPTVVDLVTKVYQACGDSKGLNRVLSLQEQRNVIFEHASSSRSAEMQTTTQGNKCEAVMGEGERSVERMDTNQNPTDVSMAVLREKHENRVNVPVIEKCPLCEGDIPLESLTFGTCLNGHKWPRCCVLFTICGDAANKCCQDCNRCVSVPCIGASPWMQTLLQSTYKCPFCLGFFRG